MDVRFSVLGAQGVDALAAILLAVVSGNEQKQLNSSGPSGNSDPAALGLQTVWPRAVEEIGAV